jgi:hypothetical protein
MTVWLLGYWALLIANCLILSAEHHWSLYSTLCESGFGKLLAFLEKTNEQTKKMGLNGCLYQTDICLLINVINSQIGSQYR